MHEEGRSKFFGWAGLALVSAIMLACGSVAPLLPIVSRPGARPTVTFTPFQPLLATLTPTMPPSTATPSGVPMWVDPALPEALLSAVKLPAGFIPVTWKEQSLLRLEVSGERPLSHWVYALVAPFPTIDDGVSFE